MATTQNNKKDIAIIGVSCKFPQSENAREFWQNLAKGKEMLHFYTDEELEALGVSPSNIDDPNFVKTASVLDNLGSFDYSFFGYTKDEANMMDPQIRMLHQQVWAAIEDAGCNLDEYKGKVGVYASLSDNINWMIHTMMHPNAKVNSFFQSQLANKNFAATLISYQLNLKGPSYLIDTACSSSLSAIHIACRNLLLRECSLAVAGGVSVDSRDSHGYFYKEGMISSKDGHCKAFDASSTGTVGGNGGAVVILKRLEDALNDKDHIYAVIKSSAVNNDGNGKVGYTAPSINGQAECIQLAHKIANVSAQSISYIETHGTATKLGDPVEVEALNKAFYYNKEHQCAIGSVKTNLGHLDAAAGVSGLLKTALALSEKQIPPSLHYTNPNPEIDFENGPFYVNAELKNWTSTEGTPLRAGVSSFGIGGTNTHVVLEEAPKVAQSKTNRKYIVLPFSAKTTTSIEGYQKNLAQFLSSQEEISLADLGYTLALGRKNFKYRNFVVAQNRQEAGETLKNLSTANTPPNLAGPNKKIVFMFPGQGSQYIKMAKEVYDYEPYFKSILDEGLAILDSLSKDNYSSVLAYQTKPDDTNAAINNTKYTQPLLFLVEYAMAKLFMKWGIEPDLMIGHSLGEYTAACLSGVFTLEDGLKIIAKRAELMSSVEEGDMIALAASQEIIKPLLKENISIAAINANDTCVVSGPKKDIASLVNEMDANEISYSKLTTSHAFHSAMMDDILEDFRAALKTIKFSKPNYSFISNLSGKQMLPEDAINEDYWVKQLRNSVLFAKGIDTVLNTNDDIILVEMGPGRSLANLSRQSKNYSNHCMAVQTMRHAKEVTHDHKVLGIAVSRLWSLGVDIDWKSYYSLEERVKISAPAYCFDNYSFEATVNPLAQMSNDGFFHDKIKADLNKWFYLPNWKKSPLLDREELPSKRQNYLVFSDETPLTKAVVEHLIKGGNRVIIVTKGEEYEQIDGNRFIINPTTSDDYVGLMNRLESDFYNFKYIIYNWTYDSLEEDQILQTFYSALNMCKSVISHQTEDKKKIVLLTHHGNNILGDEAMNCSTASISILARICAQENSEIMSSSIDIEQNTETPAMVAKVVDDINHMADTATVAYRKGRRWVQFYDWVDTSRISENIPIEENKVFLITGGLGNMGKILTSHLYSTYKATVVLLGRNKLPDSDKWETYRDDKDYNAEIVDKIDKLQEYKDANWKVFYYDVDIAHLANFKEVVKKIEDEHGKLSGVIHAAGNLNSDTFKLVENISKKDAEAQFAPKISGLLNLYTVFKKRKLDFVWLASSLSSIAGGLTFASYAYANKFMNAFLESKSEELNNWLSVSLDGLSKERIDFNELEEVFERSLKLRKLPHVVVSVKSVDMLLLLAEAEMQQDESMLSETMTDRPQLAITYVPPENEFEEKLCGLWQSFFGYSEIGVLDDFFELGGDSLKAMSLNKRIQSEFGVEINLQDFYLKSTIRALSEEIELRSKLAKIQNQSKKENTIKI